MKEFQLIENYFSGQGPQRRDVLLGIGDDCALVQPTANKTLAISVDTLVENVHFYPDVPPAMLGYKAIAVNISDLAAMGAEPAWMTLALSLPSADDAWLAEFSRGLFDAADYFGIALIGGDTTRGRSKSITVTVLGQMPMEKALTRSGAKIGDWIYVTGTLGDAAMGLKALQGEVLPEGLAEFFIERHYRPIPRLITGQCLRGLASSAIDLSDGLAFDIKHILKASNVGATIHVEQLPLSAPMLDCALGDEALQLALTGGEDYELLFTVSEAQKGAMETVLNQHGLKYHRIGQITAGDQLKLLQHGEPFTVTQAGFQHFES